LLGTNIPFFSALTESKIEFEPDNGVAVLKVLGCFKDSFLEDDMLGKALPVFGKSVYHRRHFGGGQYAIR